MINKITTNPLTSLITAAVLTMGLHQLAPSVGLSLFPVLDESPPTSTGIPVQKVNRAGKADRLPMRPIDRPTAIPNPEKESPEILDQRTVIALK